MRKSRPFGYGGAFNELGNAAGDELDHCGSIPTAISTPGSRPIDYTYNATTTVNSNGYATDSAGDYQLGVSANGNDVLIIGGPGDYYLQLGVKTIPVSGTGRVCESLRCGERGQQ